MKTITIVTESITDRELTAAVPSTGVTWVDITRIGPVAVPTTAESRVSFRSARFHPEFRIDMVVDDDAVDAVIDSVSFAYGAGFFGDAEVWIGAAA